jgi:thermostable 8-oxoguanine DNA glycosylase
MSKFLIDPINITKFNSSKFDLELQLLFWICAAGKNGVTSARCLDRLLTCHESKGKTPLQIIDGIDRTIILEDELKRFGIGCYGKKADFFRSLINARLDLKTCTVEELETVKGIGPKTSRCFLIHTRKNQQYAGLDTHVLKFLKEKGHDVPKSTPTKKKYKDLEKIFLEYVANSGKTVAEFDLAVWNEYRNRR